VFTITATAFRLVAVAAVAAVAILGIVPVDLTIFVTIA
jgi:hypothetical protein